MLSRSVFIPAALVGVCSFLAPPIVPAAHAGAIISFGGGVTGGGLLEVRDDYWAPMGWISVGGDLGESWTGFVRGGYEQHRLLLSYATCMGPGCPEIPLAEQRATYVPVSVGLRLLAPRPAVSSLRAYLEAAASVAWARYEREVQYVNSQGPAQSTLVTSDHWLPGIEVGAGFNQRLTRGLGLECGLRYAYRGAPHPTDANFGFDTSRDAFGQVSLVGALVMGGP